MTVDLLPETMRFVSIGEDGRFQLEFVFEVTCGLARFTLPVTVGGQASLDEALAEATDKVRILGLALARAARGADWNEPASPRASVPARVKPSRCAGRAVPAPFRLERHNVARGLAVAEPVPGTSATAQCCDAI
jgi:hypothetical protein